MEVFRRFFERIVEECLKAGLVWGEDLFFDATKVEANASMESRTPRFAAEALLGELLEDEVASEVEAVDGTPVPLLAEADLRALPASAGRWLRAENAERGGLAAERQAARSLRSQRPEEVRDPWRP